MSQALDALVGAASARYRHAGRFALHFARKKLRYDPVFRTILGQGLLADATHVLDLGCGQGLLAAWLLAARALHVDGAAQWPQGWPAPPALRSYRGLDINPHEVARARQGLAGDTAAAIEIVHADISSAVLPAADVVVILDVLHYLERAAQEQLLRRVHETLMPNGLLLLRVGDACGGLAHHIGRALDHTVALVRRGRWVELAPRPLTDWEKLLARCGFVARAVPMRVSPRFVNVLLQAQAA